MSKDDRKSLNETYVLNKRFKMKYLGSIQWFLVIYIEEGPKGVYLTKTAYADKFLERFKMRDSKTKEVPLSAGGYARDLEVPTNEEKQQAFSVENSYNVCYICVFARDPKFRTK